MDTGGSAFFMGREPPFFLIKGIYIMATKSVRVGHLRKVHKALTELLDEYDRAVPAEDIDLPSAKRDGQKPMVDSAPAQDSATVRSMNDAFPEMRRDSGLTADELNRINRR